MARMSVTLDVSRLSGWLKADAPENISLMSVTLDVSQLDMSALNCCRLEKRLDMSVMAETSQPSMGPCVLVAAVASALYSWAAVRRVLLSVKVAGHTPKPSQAVPYLTSNSAHAQRMRTLFVSDSAVPCQVERGAHGARLARGAVG